MTHFEISMKWFNCVFYDIAAPLEEEMTRSSVDLQREDGNALQDLAVTTKPTGHVNIDARSSIFYKDVPMKERLRSAKQRKSYTFSLNNSGTRIICYNVFILHIDKHLSELLTVVIITKIMAEWIVKSEDTPWKRIGRMESAPLISSLGTWVVSIMSWPIYPQYP